MMQPPLLERQRTALHTLTQLAADRARAEKEREDGLRTRSEAAKAELETTRQQLAARLEAEKSAAEEEWQRVRADVSMRFETDHAVAQKAYSSTRQQNLNRYEEEKPRIETEYEEARWTATTFLEASKKRASVRREKVKRLVQAGIKNVRIVEVDAHKLISGWGSLATVLEEPFTPKSAPPIKDPLRKMQRAVVAARQRLKQLRKLRLPKWVKGGRILWLVGFVWLLVLVPAWFVPQWYWWVLGDTALALLAGMVLRSMLHARAHAQIVQIHRPLRQALFVAEELGKRGEEVAEQRCKRQIAAATRRCHEDLRRTDARYKPLLVALEKRHEDDVRNTDEKYLPLLASLREWRDTEERLAAEHHQSLRTESQERHDAGLRTAEELHARRSAEAKARAEEQWQALATDWREGLARVTAELDAVSAESNRLFPPWSDPCWEQWPAPDSIPLGVRFGEIQVDLAHLPSGIPVDDRLKQETPAGFRLPALLPFPTCGSMLFKVADAGREPAVQVLQSVMLRYLTALPPGKVRFTIIDPVGLGENFAAFMHLADHDEALVASRIWTEPPHIEQRLSDLTEHMGTVIQKYLRNQYETIEDYNEQAGTVAEPYRVLVVANFPVNFTGDAARRLVSIASSGGSCGVFTLISVDTRQPLPQGFHLSELEHPSVKLFWKDHKLLWKDHDFNKFPLKLDSPPETERFTQILQQVGIKAKEAKRVEVNFDTVAPPPAQYWTSDSRGGVRVPLGLAGATRRQLLQLGEGTAQHVLIAGKTGSGKSTLLHALITNLALFYSPEEIELYLIDFKKGVEFKAYAVNELPHARVVAIESEREFGLSVLRRLDSELKARGDRFRNLGVHDLAGFREASGSSCPRILLIVDEFQEFFVEDDKIAQEAALLLDRLVRQGRAFGLHILLGSQTLGGAYTLARSTIDQMAVRIALQCSEADAHLILSKDNSAARLLSRPGEAIYNDANGLVEGNDLFQIVWLSNERREQALQAIRDLAQERGLTPAQPAIVFEGNAPADVSKNHLLRDLLAAPAWPAAPRAATVWLGDAIAIKDPTAAIFRPQTASNLLILGQQEETALGILAVSLFSLAAQHMPAEDLAQAGTARFYILDGSPVDSPYAGVFARLAESLPHPVKVAGWRDLPALLTELADEQARREKARDAEGATIYLFVHGLQWLRELRKEDDFGYSRRGEEKASPAKQFTTLLREGPGVRMHSLVWCDTLTNAQRSLDRQGLREFEMRVLFQMSVTDSSNLIDSPAASKLGLHRALFCSEESSQPEKFRPYSLPTPAWLAWLRERLQARQTTPVLAAGVS